ncbi:MAG: phosphatidylinositol kinase [Bacteroidetes bacterium HGW-Bacteroidetes-16]|jgi:serine/threonine-protein kinase HipA|nr:MAG: phosphatidylinositol kinase [Bacteroidetes bacterium HGW-Bacteroidetes-16]
MKLRVIYKGKYNAGVLWRDENGYHFEYEDDFISNENTFPISVNMPKSQKRVDSERLFSNFQSMLSEGYNRELQCKALGIDLSDDWSLLMYTCENDTIGAITLKRMEE